MIDPFGYSDVTLAQIEQVLKNRSSEVFLTFMDPWINRSLSYEPIEQTLNRAFGSDAWMAAFDHEEDEKRADRIVELYLDAVRGAGARHVLHFDINKSERARAYTLIHATDSDVGCGSRVVRSWAAWYAASQLPAHASHAALA